jgi:AcrR family transcriptional regulator
VPKTTAAPKSSASSHDRILDAAKHLFAKRGYENTSTVVIAREAGTSESQLMKHFGSKEGLLEAIFDQGWEKIRYFFRGVQELSTGTDKLIALLDLMVNTLDRDPDLKGLMLLEGRRIRKEGRLVMMTTGYQEFVTVLDGILAEMRAKNELRPELNLQALRSAFTGMFEALMRDQLLAQRMGFPADYSSADIRNLFPIILSALAPPR